MVIYGVYIRLWPTLSMSPGICNAATENADKQSNSVYTSCKDDRR